MERYIAFITPYTDLFAEIIYIFHSEIILFYYFIYTQTVY